MTDAQTGTSLGDTDPAMAGFDTMTEAFTHHRGPVTCVAGVPGRHLAVTSGYDSAVGIVDFDQGRIELLGYHRHLVNRIVVNETGSVAASCSSDYTIGLWNLENRTLERVLRGHWDDVEDFAFIDDETGVSVSRDRRILIWDLNTGAIVRALEKHKRDVLSVEFAKGRIYSSGDDMTLRQWDAGSGDLLRTWGPFDVETDTCAIDALNDRVVLGCDDGKIRIFDSETGSLVREIEAHRSGIKKVAVSPVDGAILSAAYDQRILVWAPDSGELLRELESHRATWERSFNWSPDGLDIFAGTFDGSVLRWAMDSGNLVNEVGKSRRQGNPCLNDISSNHTGRTAIVSDDGHLRFTGLSNVEEDGIQSAAPATGRVLMNAVFQAEGCQEANSLVLAGAHDQNLHAFSIVDGKPAPGFALNLEEGPINCIRAQRKNGGQLEAFVACYSGSVVRVLVDGTESMQVLARYPLHDGAVKALRLHPSGGAGASCAADGSMCAWSLEGEVLRSFTGHTAIVDDLDFDPSGEMLASVSRDFTVNVYEFASGLMRHSILLGRESPKCVLYWDRNRIFVGNYWGEIWQVDLSTEQVTPFPVASNGISSLSRCESGLVAASYDGTVSLLDTDSMKVIGRRVLMNQRVSGFERSPAFE